MRTYRLATIHDAERLLQMCKSGNFKVKELPSVTFVAEEDGKVEMALGLDWSGKFTVAGPMVVAPEAKKKPLMLFRLAEYMEKFLTERGGTKYLLSCACANKRWNRILVRVAKKYTTKNGRNWYIREVGSYYGRFNAG